MASLDQGYAPYSASPASWLARLLDTVRRTRLETRTYNELSTLSDRELDDLGISRADLRAVARRAVQNG